MTVTLVGPDDLGYWFLHDANGNSFPLVERHEDHPAAAVPAGWERVEDATWFADSSGWGRPGEPALAVIELKDELRRHASDNPCHGFAIVECGQFQCYVGAYRQATEGKVAS